MLLFVNQSVWSRDSKVSTILRSATFHYFKGSPYDHIMCPIDACLFCKFDKLDEYNNNMYIIRYTNLLLMIFKS